MQTLALETLVNGVAEAIKGGATASDVARIFTHKAAREALLHAASSCAAGAEPELGELREVVFGVPVHGGVGLALEDD